jgi:endonuclease YncB( thermonuclease family)
VHEKRVEARCYKRDRFGREICAVFVSRFLVWSRNVGLQQVREGMAWWFRRYADEQSAEDRGRYESAEQEARSRKRGSWRDTHPVPPWECRRKQ